MIEKNIKQLIEYQKGAVFVYHERFTSLLEVLENKSNDLKVILKVKRICYFNKKPPRAFKNTFEITCPISYIRELEDGWIGLFPPVMVQLNKRYDEEILKRLKEIN